MDSYRRSPKACCNCRLIRTCPSRTLSSASPNDPLGRRLSKHSQAHYQEHREAGPHWNRSERVKRNRELQCGFTLYGWDGDALAWESKIGDEDGLGARTTHYVYEPGSFVPVAQAVREEAIALLDQPE